jgi:hypothetical protein
VLVEPTDPPPNAMHTQVRIWEKQVDEHMKRETMLEENLKTVYSLINGQCSDVLWAKLESRPNHATIEGAADSIGLQKHQDSDVPISVTVVQSTSFT